MEGARLAGTLMPTSAAHCLSPSLSYVTRGPIESEGADTLLDTRVTGVSLI